MARKQYQKLNDTFKFDKIIKKQKPALETYGKSNLIYNSKPSFYKYYRDSKKFVTLSLKSKYLFLLEYSNNLTKFKVLKAKKQSKKKEKNRNKKNQNEYNELLGDKWNRMDPKNFFLKRYDYSVWSENRKESTDENELTDKEKSVDLSDMLPLEGDEEEVKQRKLLRILNPKKQLPRLPISLAA